MWDERIDNGKDPPLYGTKQPLILVFLPRIFQKWGMGDGDRIRTPPPSISIK